MYKKFDENGGQLRCQVLMKIK